jgi:hypothetical protein
MFDRRVSAYRVLHAFRCCAAIFGIIAGPCTGQSFDSAHGPFGLIGVKDVAVTPSVSGSGKEDCGVTTDDLGRSAKFVLASSPLRVAEGRERQSKPNLQIDVMTLFDPGLRRCTYAILVYVDYMVNAKFPAGDVPSSTLQWLSQRLGYAPRAEGRQDLLGSVEQLVKSFVVDWVRVNEISREPSPFTKKR